MEIRKVKRKNGKSLVYSSGKTTQKDIEIWLYQNMNVSKKFFRDFLKEARNNNYLYPDFVKDGLLIIVGIEKGKMFFMFEVKNS